jgi:hypothetical protein
MAPAAEHDQIAYMDLSEFNDNYQDPAGYATFAHHSFSSSQLVPEGAPGRANHVI